MLASDFRLSDLFFFVALWTERGCSSGQACRLPNPLPRREEAAPAVRAGPPPLRKREEEAPAVRTVPPPLRIREEAAPAVPEVRTGLPLFRIPEEENLAVRTDQPPLQHTRSRRIFRRLSKLFRPERPGGQQPRPVV